MDRLYDPGLYIENNKKAKHLVPRKAWGECFALLIFVYIFKVTALPSLSQS